MITSSSVHDGLQICGIEGHALDETNDQKVIEIDCPYPTESYDSQAIQYDLSHNGGIGSGRRIVGMEVR